LPLLRGFDDLAVLTALAGRFVQQEYQPGDVIVTEGTPRDAVFLVAHGKLDQFQAGKFGDASRLDVLGDGHFFGEQALGGDAGLWPFTVRAATSCTLLVLRRRAVEQLNGTADVLRGRIAQALAAPGKPRNHKGEADIEVSSGHTGEPALPG